MAITVTKPVAAPTGLNAVVQAGGSLAPSTTYYYIVIAYDIEYTTCGAGNRRPHFSDISAEGSFVTTTTDLSVLITWINSTGANYYNVLISTTSGDYTNCGGYDGILNENIGNITDGTTGLTVTAISTSTSVFHSVQLSNPMSPHVSNDLGIIDCFFSGTGTENLDTLYADIVSAGFSDYVYYDGYNFVLKGWIHTNSSDVGEFVVESKRIIMLKAGIEINSPTGGYVFRFGRWHSDAVKGNPYYGCNIDLQGARYTFKGYNPGNLLCYDCHVSFSRSRTGSEPMSDGYFNGGSGSYFTYDLANFQGTIMNGSVRGNSSLAQDLKWAQGNNYANVDHVRLNLWGSANMPYSAGLGSFYDCDWNVRVFRIYTFGGYPLNYTNMYNCRFNDTTAGDGILAKPDISVYVNNNDPPTSLNYIMNHYGLNMTVLDEDGNALEDVTVSAVDGLGNPAVWIEGDGTENNLVTGNEFSTDRSTDANGNVNYYLKSYKSYLNPNNTENISNYSYDTFQELYYPYTFTFSKAGYRDYTIEVQELLEEVTGVVTLEQSEPAPLKFTTVKVS